MAYRTDIPTTVLNSSNQNTSLVKNKFGYQNESYSRTQNRDERSIALASEILKTSVSCKQGIHPRIFCRRWFGLSAINKNGSPRFTKRQILAMETEHGYREQCINLIAKLLKIKPNTVHRWGKGVTFDKIPADKRQKYELYLSYIDAIRIITSSLAELDEALLLKLLRQLEIRQ